MKIVVIGAVAAGLKAASKARRSDPTAEITVIEKGEMISYGACGMPYYVAAEVNEIEDLMKTPAGAMRNPEYFKNVKDITVLNRTLATAIDRKSKFVTVKNLATDEVADITYDKLVIATGAAPLKPNITGVDLKNVFKFWHPDDARAVKLGLQSKKFSNAVIVGAGLIGMEMAEAFSTWGINVAVVEMKEQLFPALLDAEVAGILEKYLRTEGIEIFTGEKVIRFVGDSVVTAVETDKRTIPADLVIMAMGVRPNVELAKSAGLELGPTGAIAVDAELRTSDANIFAGGDCVENIHLVSGRKVYAPMGSTANKHGRVIGDNLCGGHEEFKGVLGTAAVRVLDLNIGKTGLTEREAKELGYDYVTVITTGHDKPHYMPESKAITTKLIADAKTGKVLGLQAIGEGEVAKRIDVVAAVLTLDGKIGDLFDIDLSYAPPFNSPIDNVAVAANSIMNKLAGKFKGISSLQAKELLADDKVVFLDVRTPAEFEQLRLANCKNVKHIPLGQLRSRLKELNKGDEIIAFCKISLRGYEAEGILEGQDFENVKVMEGGLAAWPFECEK